MYYLLDYLMMVGSFLHRVMLVHHPLVLAPPRPLLPTGRNVLHLWGEKERTQQYGAQNFNNFT